MIDKITTIRLKKSTRDRLASFGGKDDSFDTIINQILDKIVGGEKMEFEFKIFFNEIDDEFKVLDKKGFVLSSGKTQQEAIDGAVDCFGISEDEIQRL